jgi:hypothetical protein
MNHSIPWSGEDDQRLRSLAQSAFSLTEISRQMQRGVSSVRSRARKYAIAIARDRNPMQAQENICRLVGFRTRAYTIGLSLKWFRLKAKGR